MEANTGREKAHTNTAPWTCENLGSRRSSSPDRKPLHYTIMDRVCKPLHAPTGSITSSTPPSVRLLVPKASCSMVRPRNLPAPLPTSNAWWWLSSVQPQKHPHPRPAHLSGLRAGGQEGHHTTLAAPWPSFTTALSRKFSVGLHVGASAQVLAVECCRATV